MEFAEIKNITGFFKDEYSKKWTMKIKSMYDNIKILFKLNTLPFQVATNAEIYKYTITTQDYKKLPLGWVVYYPEERILEVFDISNPDRVLIRFKGKQVLMSNLSPMLEKAGVDTLFKRLTNVL